MGLRFIDLSIIASYLIGMILLGIKLGKSNKSTEEYFLAGRSMPFFPVGLSVIATMVSAASFISVPGASYIEGFRYFMINSNLPLVLFISICFFLPFLYNLKVTSCYEYIGKRFNSIVRIICAVSFMLTSIILVSTMVYGPALILHSLTGWNMEFILILSIVIVVFYTMMGGIRAVIWSDAVQMVILWAGIFFCFIIALKNTGVSFMEAMDIAKTAGKFNALDFHLDLKLNNGFWVSIIGVGLMHLQYFTCDQSQVQRLFTSKSMLTLKKSMLLSGVLVNIQFALFVIIGLLMFAGSNGEMFTDTNAIFIDFISNRIPVGIYGLILSAIFAATMSSVDSLLNSMSTVFVTDIYVPYLKNKAIHTKASDLSVSHVITIICSVMIFFFTYLVVNGSTTSLITLIGVYCSYLTGSILGVFLLGIFTKKSTSFGATIGFFLGVFSTIVVANTTDINWGWYNLVGVLACVIPGYLISLLFPASQSTIASIEKYTYMGMRKKMELEGKLKEDGVYIVPGYLDKYAYFMLLIFVVQFVVLMFFTTI